MRFNALRHGLRSLQTVVPGEAPEELESHRAAIVEDLKPEGAIELALAEQIAVKLWRLGRVVRHEADLVAISQDPDLAFILGVWDRLTDECKRRLLEIIKANLPAQGRENRLSESIF